MSKRRRREPEQGSMLTLMGYKPVQPGLHHGVVNHAITVEEYDGDGNQTRLSHEPVPDDGSDDDGFWCSLMHQAGG